MGRDLGGGQRLAERVPGQDVQDAAGRGCVPLSTHGLARTYGYGTLRDLLVLLLHYALQAMLFRGETRLAVLVCAATLLNCRVYTFMLAALTEKRECTFTPYCNNVR